MIYNKDSLIMAKEKNRYLVAGYTNEYINKALGSKYVPFCPVYDARKIMQFIEKNDDKFYICHKHNDNYISHPMIQVLLFLL